MWYVRDYGLNTDVVSKNDYFWIKEATEDPGSYCVDIGKVTSGKRVVAVDWEALQEKLDVMESDFRPWGTADDEESSGDDDDPDGDDGSQPQYTPLEDIEDGETTTVSVRIDDPDTDTPEAISVEATTVDETAELRLVVWESSECDVALEDGDHYRLADVKVSEYNGDLELPVQEYTEFASIGQGVGHTLPDDSGDNATLNSEDVAADEAATGGGAPPDGDDVPEDAEGMLADARRLADLLKQRGIPLEGNEIVVAASINRVLMDSERAKEVLDYAVSEKGAHHGDRRRVHACLNSGVHRDPRNWRQQPLRSCWKAIFST